MMMITEFQHAEYNTAGEFIELYILILFHSKITTGFTLFPSLWSTFS